MKVEVHSTENKKNYSIEKMLEYDVETSLDIPADYFKLVLSNPENEHNLGIHAELFNPNDTFKIIEHGDVILQGISDDIDEGWDENGGTIEIVGRDKSLLLLENDAIPKTYYNLKLSALINQITKPYGFKTKVNSKYDKTIKKIVVDVGMSDWDLIFEETKKLDMWLWCEPDGTIVADKLNYNQKPSYTFSNNLHSSIDHIRMTKFNKKKRGADIKNEVWVRGHGKKAFTHKYIDKKLTSKGYKRRLILEDGDAKSVAKAKEIGKNKANERKRGSFEIEIEVHGKHNIKMNRTAIVRDDKTRTHDTYLIVGVKNIKSNTGGYIQRIRLRPLWEGL